MTTSDNQTTSQPETSSNNFTGNSNWAFQDGQLQSSEGNTLDESSNLSGGSGNPFSGGDTESDNNNPFAGGNAENNPQASNLPDNLPFGDTLPSLPEVETDQPVPFNSDNFILDVNNLESDSDSTGNTGSGNGNWNLGSNNTTDGNGNWNFSSDSQTSGNGNWNYADGNTSTGNGNWNFSTDNQTNGNGNWQLGESNTVLGNANMPEGSNNNILGSGNTADVSDSNLLGNRLEIDSDGSAIGNEDWAFPLSSDSEPISLGSSQPSQAIGFDINTGVSSLFGSGGATQETIDTATNLPDYNNPNYTFEGLG